MCLSFYNPAYASIWNLDERFLTGSPHMTDLLEWLREHRRLPEQADFAAYRRQKLRQAQSLIEPEEEKAAFLERARAALLSLRAKGSP